MPINSFALGLGSSVGIAPVETLVPGPATGTFTDVTGTYQIPANATMILWDGVAGGGGGASGSAQGHVNLTGGGGGGGGGRTTKWISAAALRAAYPSGVPYTVGHGGQGGAAATTTNLGNDGAAGGYTFAGDFFVATPGNLYGPAKAGGDFGVHATDGLFYGLGGSNGLGDTPGCQGGMGGGLQVFLTNVTTDFTGNNGGYPQVLFGNNFNDFVITPVSGGGGGAGGGGGGISSTAGPFNGGNSGYAITADPTPLVGVGGVVDTTQPTTAGASVVSGTSTQGGGGGGASTIGTSVNGQAGANALANSGSGGGGGGASFSGSSGKGGNGGSGFLRIVAY